MKGRIACGMMLAIAICLTSTAAFAFDVVLPSGQKAKGEMVGNKLMLIDAKGARIQAPDGRYRSVDGKMIIVQGGQVAQKTRIRVRPSDLPISPTPPTMTPMTHGETTSIESADTYMGPSQERQRAPVVIKQNQLPLPPGPRVRLPRSGCPDPAAHRIDFSIVQRTSQSLDGRVKIVGVVKNVGGAAYESRPNQQEIYLYQNTTLVARQQFQNLAPGQTATVQFERAWDSWHPGYPAGLRGLSFTPDITPGMSPPEYELVISYDPDINIDGNPKNDDCRSANNRMKRSGADINALFH